MAGGQKIKKTILIGFAILLTLAALAAATPATTHQAQKAVKGWLIKTKARPLGAPLGQTITKVDSFTDGEGEVIYHIVYLQPSGFVIVPADDLIEPIIGFASAGHYDPSLDNPLGALVTQDLKARAAVAREVGKRGKLHEPKSLSENKNKWRSLEYTGEQLDDSVEMQAASVSDVRVAPLVQSRWDQTTVCDSNCYNLYTPNNYPCGCVATAMAQLMRYYQHPVGTYSWTDMVLIPDCSTTLIQRQAVGTLCHDAGVAVNMVYDPNSSSADTLDAADAFVNAFNYGNAVKGYNSGNNIGSGLNSMLNPNLDASYPCLLGIKGSPGSHAIVCDGYGYDSSTLYHHLNMGWSGVSDAWYDLPDIDNTAIGNFNSVYKCVYNVYNTGSGEIISGRVTDNNGNPISNAIVTATRTGGGTYIATTNSKGIYALAEIPRNSTYTIAVTRTGYIFASRNISTGTSTGYSNTSGNVWGADFEACATKYSGGTGTENDPYRIATPQDLNDIGNHQEDWDKHFILVNDINLAEFTGTQFKIIGPSYNTPFTGVFDGNYHTIWNFTWSSTDRDNIGLLGYVGEGAQIKSLGTENVDVNSVNGMYVGGLVGRNSYGTITGCYSTGSVSGTEYVGGLVGDNYYGTITNCYSAGSVSGNVNVGGLVGLNSYGTITGCYLTGSVSGVGDYAGGLVGRNYSGPITNSYSTGSVSGQDGVGGLVGENDSSGMITKCYSTGSVSGNYAVGGLVGWNKSTVIASFWDVNTSGQSKSAGGTPKTTAEMKTKSTFTDAGWDFVGETTTGTNDYWRMCVDSVQYPMLIWQFLSGDFACPDGVDTVDLGFFVERWLNSPCNQSNNFCNCTDINRSGQVDLPDFAIFASHWLEEK